MAARNILRSKYRLAASLLALLLFLIVITCGLFVVYYPEKVFEFYRGEDEISIWVKIKPFNVCKKISDTNTYKSPELELSPDKKHLAFYDMVREKIYDKEWFINVVDIRTLKKKVVFVGTHKTSFIKWIDNNTIRVYLSVGTGAIIHRDVDINSSEPFIAIDHMSPEYWTSEKKPVSFQ